MPLNSGVVWHGRHIDAYIFFFIYFKGGYVYNCLVNYVYYWVRKILRFKSVAPVVLFYNAYTYLRVFNFSVQFSIRAWYTLSTAVHEFQIYDVLAHLKKKNNKPWCLKETTHSI